MKQHVAPLVIENGNIVRLQSVQLKEGPYDEKWIQNICFQNPNIIPINEIEPSFGGIVSICQELRTDSGPCDLVFINANGFITLVECKLWRNPEARRKAVGQILDYAKDVAQWDYSRFETECLKSRSTDYSSLYEILKDQYPDVIEQELADRIQMNLERGRFLLLIIGDGIRENMEDLISYVQGYGGMSFTLGLVEMPVFMNPESKQLTLTPRILAKTKEIERTVIRIEDGTRLKELSAKDSETAHAVTLSEKDFFERLTASRGERIESKLRRFIEDLEKDGFIIKIGRGKRLSLNIKSSTDTYNFGSVQENGEVWFYGIVNKTEELGKRQIGIDYLKKLASIIKGQFDDSRKQWNWCVKRKGKYILIDEYLTVQEEWKELIRDTIMKIQEAEEE